VFQHPQVARSRQCPHHAGAAGTGAELERRAQPWAKPPTASISWSAKVCPPQPSPQGASSMRSSRACLQVPAQKLIQPAASNHTLGSWALVPPLAIRRSAARTTGLLAVIETQKREAYCCGPRAERLKRRAKRCIDAPKKLCGWQGSGAGLRHEQTCVQRLLAAALPSSTPRTRQGRCEQSAWRPTLAMRCGRGGVPLPRP